MPRTTTATPVPVPKPPGRARRKRSWVRRRISSRLGGTGPRGPPGPLPRPPPPQGPPPPPPPPRGPVPHGPPPSLCQIIDLTLSAALIGPRRRAGDAGREDAGAGRQPD